MKILNMGKNMSIVVNDIKQASGWPDIAEIEKRPNTKISVFRVTGLKILCRIGKKYNFMHFERHFAF